MRAGQNLLGMIGGKTVERLVQVHDEAMQAVVIAAGQSGQSGDLRLFDSIVERRWGRRFDGGEALNRRTAFVCIAGFHRLSHGGDVIKDRHCQLAEAGRHDPLVCQMTGAIDERLHREGVDTGSAAFVRHIEAGAVRIAGVTSRRLQDAQPSLHPVIGLQALGDEGGEQDVALAEFFNN
ncbi:MAG: hypothetical protein WDN48_16735 [Pseudolabrys sp.]